MTTTTPPPRPDKAKAKKKKKAKKTIIENIPDIPEHNEDHIVPYTTTPPDCEDVEGTSVCPIYVSDYEDSSEVAIRGDRKIDRDIERVDAFNKKWKTELSSPEEKVAENALDHQTRKSLVGVSEKNASKTETKKKKRNLKKSIAKLSNRNNNREAEKKPLRIDVAALAGEDGDPILERELEEIALNGRRSGLISGTPEKSAYDIENGKARGWRKKSKNKITPFNSNTFDPNDDKDKSWLSGTLTKDMESKQKMARKRMVYFTGLFVVAVAAAVIASFGIIKSKRKSLTPEQKVIHDILARVTGEKTLTDSKTPQGKAREWLLYADAEVWSIESQKDIFQRYALATFHFATGGEQWQTNNWLSGPVCGDDKQEAWNGIDCDSKGNIRVLALGEHMH